MNQLIWFRNDLRLNDQSALWHATQAGTTLALVIFSPEQWQRHDDAPIKIDFYLRQLAQLKDDLTALNIPLIVRTIPLWKDIPDELVKLVEYYKIENVYANVEVGINELERDHQAQTALNAIQKDLKLYQDKTLFTLGSIRNKSDAPYQVYTPFKKNCYELLNISLPQCFPQPEAQSDAPKIKADDSKLPSMTDLGYDEIDKKTQALWPVGEKAAHKRLEAFIKDKINHYHELRDYPAAEGTSCISPYLTIGLVSIRQCVQAIFAKHQGQFLLENKGQEVWLNELLWREFYQQLMFDFPKLSRHQPFQDQTKTIPWKDNDAHFEAWTQGQTGIPIVDAAMRQLKATGWMHNRVRMICAMFLTKNLLIDWRKGEQWFMQHLIDGDFAANNGGWQWSASTGTDAAPYFRIFNPVSQSEKFDPDGKFLREWLPELKHLDNTQIHEPYASKQISKLNYPKPIVDLKASRAEAIEVFKNN
ncbi:deoxyribodipyrimidine photo-lyase [Acinetobacter soli]|uniref:deoxyribodipyrimidine photo-lyase n=1 Tax=Acinetobacter soli TaxID=487316 RepID=UPI002588218A|nr:deoxyribodipyrimidine photo-lyase [uncultured Acinetobacter sp.]